jgi:hypothetical protein
MQGRAMEQPSNPPPGLSTGSPSNPAVKISESELMQQEFEDLLDRIPKQARFLLTASCRPADWTNFISLTKLVSEQIDLSNPVGLVYVRDFVAAVIDSIRLAELREQILDNEQRSILRAQIARGLLLERRPDHEIDLEAVLMTKEYFELRSPWRELTQRFPNVFGRHQLEAAAFQVRLLDISRIELMIKNCEQRRDRALKNLAVFRKPEAQRLRELARSVENPDVKSPLDSEIVIPAKS